MLERLGLDRPQPVSQASQSWRLSPFSFPYLFKRFNDTHGHDAGDAVLQALGRLLQEHFRQEDIVCRYGGEEFAVLVDGASLANGLVRAEGLRLAASDTYSVQFPYIRNPTGYTSISRNTYFFLLPPVGFSPQTARDSIGIRMRCRWTSRAAASAAWPSRSA